MVYTDGYTAIPGGCKDTAIRLRHARATEHPQGFPYARGRGPLTLRHHLQTCRSLRRNLSLGWISFPHRFLFRLAVESSKVRVHAVHGRGHRLRAEDVGRHPEAGRPRVVREDEGRSPAAGDLPFSVVAKQSQTRVGDLRDGCPRRQGQKRWWRVFSVVVGASCVF